MKLKIPHVMDSYLAKEYVVLMMKAYKKHYIDPADISIETYPSWDFYKVSLFRWSKCSSGCGTHAFREKLWDEHKAGILDLFKIKGVSRHTWRWRYEYTIEIDEFDSGSVPGIEFCIEKE